MPSDLETVHATWQQLGERDPFWAILATPGKQGGNWDVEEFYDTGRVEVARILDHATNLRVPASRRRALDFGCGAGRLAQALCREFEHCVGVDIAESMIELARTHNRYPDRCEYVHNLESDLRRFPDDAFDCVCSMLVLQHMPPDYGESYIREFVRVLAPGGLLVFQVPSKLKISNGSNITSIQSGLPESGYSANLSIGAPKLLAAPSQQIAVEVTVQNGGDVTWPAHGREDGWFQIKLGNHWLDDTGNLIRLDDGRATLPYDLTPGAGAKLSILVTAPEKPGSYILEFDMVQEMVAWFGNKNSPTCRVPIMVQEAEPAQGESSEAPPAAVSDSELIRGIQMHAIRVSEVRRILAESGGKLLSFVEDGFAGPEWVSFRYFVTK